MSDTRAASQTVRYRERLSVPLWWWLPGLGLAALIATHNMELAARMDRVVRLEDGRIVV